MDGVDFQSFVGGAIDFISSMSDKAADMDGRVAFVLGMLTWFAVEQAVRRLAGILRWAILIGAVGAGGFALVTLFTPAFGPEHPAASSTDQPSSSGE